MKRINAFVLQHVKKLEMLGVLMRIFSFGLLAIMGKNTPLLFMWTVNTADAILLSLCAIVRKDASYILLNVFWIGVGLVGMYTAIYGSLVPMH